jgi:hypothetical protein
MNRLLPAVSLASLLLIAFAGLAAADVTIRVAVTPTSIPQCGQGQLFVAVGNTGTAPILARVCFALEKVGTGTVFGPFCGRLALAAGERRQHEFTFTVPPPVPAGDYAFVARATASDGTSDQAAAPFSVTSGACVGPAGGTADDLLNAALQSVGATPEGTTPTRPSTWGEVKIRYR